MYVQEGSPQGWSSEERNAVYGLMRAQRLSMIDFLRGPAKRYAASELFSAFKRRVVRILVDLKKLYAKQCQLKVSGQPTIYPPDLLYEIIEETKRVTSELAQKLDELSEQRQVGQIDPDVIAELIIDDVKETSKQFISEVGRLEPKCERVSAEVVMKELRELVPELVLPEGNYAFKGGVARLALKLYASKIYPERFDRRLLEAELPLSDFDAIVGPDVDVWEAGRLMGCDTSGIEARKDFDLSNPGSAHQAILEYAKTRDSNMNEALLTSKYLFFTPEAMEGVLTGVIEARSRVQNLYGTDIFHVKGRPYMTSRAIHRLIKMVVEGKALAFNIRRYNFDVRLGMYALVLHRKWYGKPKCGKRLAALYSIGRFMGHTSASTPKQYLLELLEEYPHFSFISNQSPIAIARWILEKYYAVVDRHVRRKFEISSEWGSSSDDPALVRIELVEGEVTEEEKQQVEELLSFLVRNEEEYLAQTKITL